MSLDLGADGVITSPEPRTAFPGDPAAVCSPLRRAATQHALGRDLNRLTRVLAEPVTAVRRTALVGHISYLVDQVRSAHPTLADRQTGTLSRFRKEARRWSREPARRPALLAVTEHTAAALVPSITGADHRWAVDDRGDHPRAAAAAGSGASGASAPLRLADLLAQRPTALAYRHFWLLDDLPAQLAEPLTREFTGPARWVLRNVLSGGYNRRAYLMWVGGGTGPAV